ncbi:protein of unknown function [Candidatus Hydrogenisulfobacillus filiaventi]|uniref:Ribbon-helix-helix protein CopG domain-containing protein n=1 Tax=Candidatus Hydrogenisulfobacillus filiaventi TaxID=2707344 RepID=A0A6F8ZIU3_9FIRM|nr:protein of unknown function [Candidatus Hydrogenisulfobacillus filiaventi]
MRRSLAPAMAWSRASMVPWTVRVSPRVLAQLREAADAKGVPMAEIIRRAIAAAVEESQLDPVWWAQDTEALAGPKACTMLPPGLRTRLVAWGEQLGVPPSTLLRGIVRWYLAERMGEAS